MGLSVLILGYGEMGHALEYLLSDRHAVRIWTRSSPTTLEDEAEKAQVILFCLPVVAHADIVRRLKTCLRHDSLCLSIAKGLDESGMTALQVFAGTFAENYRYGVIYGPMISEEIRQGKSAFADVSLSRVEDFETVRNLFQGGHLVCRQVSDMSGSSWAVILKNVYAIMFGVADGLKLGDNMRGHLMVKAMSELSSIVQTFGADADTPFGYSGMGDLLTTATSENSHHHELGRRLAVGELTDISGEGVHTLQMVEKYKLFDSAAYPLFSMVRDIVAKPDTLNARIDAYLKQARAW